MYQLISMARIVASKRIIIIVTNFFFRILLLLLIMHWVYLIHQYFKIYFLLDAILPSWCFDFVWWISTSSSNNLHWPKQFFSIAYVWVSVPLSNNANSCLFHWQLASTMLIKPILMSSSVFTWKKNQNVGLTNKIFTKLIPSCPLLEHVILLSPIWTCPGVMCPSGFLS